MELAFRSAPRRKALASCAPDRFDPIPLPIIALSCAVVSLSLRVQCHSLRALSFCQIHCCLSEFETGTRVSRAFEEIEYGVLYAGIVRNLNAYEKSKGRGHFLGQIREQILDEGR